ncbi:MAG: energy-coupled thiamine transporter ThiT [Oscillospiraceae bacterium]|nr:energy-coupled thiamine transporter ThiT [Oscillospiraceae bacterium]
MNTPYSRTRILVEGALMTALATILSFIPIFELPHGGSITLVSMLPLLVMSFRHGPKWGMFTAFVNSLVQLFLGLKNLAYCQTLGAQIGCILLDYILGFTVLGLAVVLAKPFKHKLAGVAFSSTAVCLLRFLCSFLSGYIVWKDYDYAFEWMNNFGWGAWFTQHLGQDALCWVYSFFYNASYMLPEIVLTIIGILLLYRFGHKLFERQERRVSL